MPHQDSDELWRVRFRLTARMSSTQVSGSALQNRTQSLSKLELSPAKSRPLPRVILVKIGTYFSKNIAAIHRRAFLE